tara:strand:- start:356 stop:712 length:357 start_codon:yes stop_codon:yes gene_type:complete
MRYWKPLFFENSKIPVWLSKLAPININALSFAFFVWCRGELSERAKRHETIHYQQQLELLFVFQWLLYGIFWLWGCWKLKDGKKAYYRCPFEQEAYQNEYNLNYFEFREYYAWRKYKI